MRTKVKELKENFEKELKLAQEDLKLYTEVKDRESYKLGYDAGYCAGVEVALDIVKECKL